MILEVIGWIGAICFGFCAIPQAYKSYTEKHSNGLSSGFLALWTIGEVCTLAYVLPTMQWPLIANYVANLLCLAVILYYKLRKT